MKFDLLPKTFYAPSASVVAPLLLGHWLIRKTPDGICGGEIVETEAYVADDPACHAFRGKSTRNASMFGDAGLSYVYLIYGYHFCFNAVCQPSGIGEAVLIRAIEPTFGVDELHKNRAVENLKNLTNGPAKLCSAMKIDRELDGANLCDSNSLLIIARNPALENFLKTRGEVITTTRIGISKAADAPLRFYLANSAFVSKKLKFSL